MLKKKVPLILALLFSFFLVTFSLAANPTPDPATIEKAANEYLANICAKHGGVNCSIINKDASIVCNDGTIDESLSTIYAVPQCQKTIEDLANQQSDFMAESGCYPPSEMACVSEVSYQNLYKILIASGLANSELGRDELAQCRQQIGEYSVKNTDYKKCLIENNNSQFDVSSARFVQPLLKVIFCPIFYGPSTSYNSDADLCSCDNGYFMSGGKCVEATKICQSKYGPGTSAQYGNCSKPVSVPTPISLEELPSASPRITPSSFTGQNSSTLRPTIQSSQSPVPSDQSELESNPATTINTSFITRIVTAIISKIRNIFKLF
ncbi:MAG: hypothetical protein Q7S43_03770 [bacterium]|nr:hypothetical protein [bacterium]